MPRHRRRTARRGPRSSHPDRGRPTRGGGDGRRCRNRAGPLRRAEHAEDVVPCRTGRRRARLGDPSSRRQRRSARRSRLPSNLLDPDAVILGGGVGLNADEYRACPRDARCAAHIWLEIARERCPFSMPSSATRQGSSEPPDGALDHTPRRSGMSSRVTARSARSRRRATRCTTRSIRRSPTRSARVGSAPEIGCRPSGSSASSSR